MLKEKTFKKLLTSTVKSLETMKKRNAELEKLNRKNEKNIRELKKEIALLTQSIWEVECGL